MLFSLQRVLHYGVSLGPQVDLNNCPIGEFVLITGVSRKSVPLGRVVTTGGRDGYAFHGLPFDPYGLSPVREITDEQESELKKLCDIDFEVNANGFHERFCEEIEKSGLPLKDIQELTLWNKPAKKCQTIKYVIRRDQFGSQYIKCNRVPVICRFNGIIKNFEAGFNSTEDFNGCWKNYQIFTVLGVYNSVMREFLSEKIVNILEPKESMQDKQPPELGTAAIKSFAGLPTISIIKGLYNQRKKSSCLIKNTLERFLYQNSKSP